MNRENVRLVFAIVLSFCIFVLFDVFFIKKEPLKQTSDSGEAVMDASKTTSTTAAEPAQAVVPSDEATQDALQEKVMSSDREITVETRYYIAKFSEKNGSIKSFALKQYRESISKDAPFKGIDCRRKRISVIVLTDFSRGLEASWSSSFLRRILLSPFRLKMAAKVPFLPRIPSMGLFF